MNPFVFLLRVWTKCVVLFLFLRTKISRLFISDPTQIFIDYETPAQIAAWETLKPREISSSPRVLYVVIPFKDKVELTKSCYESIRQQRVPQHWTLQIIFVDHESKDSKTIEWMQNLKGKENVKFIRVDGEYNFSRMNQRAVASIGSYSKDSAVCFVNNDVTLDSRDFLGPLIEFLDRTQNVGALGCTLLYPNGKVQHLFAAPGIKIVAAHPLKNMKPKRTWQWFKAEVRPVAAVTGALMMMRLEDYGSCGGFDEELPTLGQDIDLCLKLQEKGKINCVMPNQTATHHEGKTKSGGFSRVEVERMYSKWQKFLIYNPFYSEKFSRWSEFPLLAFGEGEYPWQKMITRSTD